MAKGGLTLEQVRAIVEDEDLDRADLAEVLAESFGVTLPEDIKGEELAQFVFETYQKKAQEITDERKSSKTKRSRRSKKGQGASPSTSSDDGTSRSAFIVGLIKQDGVTTRKDLEEALDEAFHYTEAGKSPRTRVNRVLRNLKNDGKINLDGGKVTWIEES
jgi:hypothetical protein